MKIKSLQLKNFKRFTDLTLQDIPENAKLVLLIGSNGSGKSSVFDAFEFLSGIAKNTSTSKLEYFQKVLEEDTTVILLTHDGEQIIRQNQVWQHNKTIKNGFYGRTSFRQIPRLTRTRLGEERFDISSDTDRPISFIERDNRFENDLEKITGDILREVFSGNDISTKDIKTKYIKRINDALDNIFPKENGTKLKLVELLPPLDGKVAQILFDKGVSTVHYDILSAGEKEVFNILINLVARSEYYQDTIYFFDEIDLHLNTQLQYNFIKEIVEHWIPNNCQFWTASHSLGFIQYAKEIDHSAIFDFDDFDFDFSKVLFPIPKDNPDIYEIAVNKEILPLLFRDYKIFFVENKDRHIYSELNISNTLFVQENGKTGVYHKVKNGRFAGIIDRDFLTDNDINEIENQYKSLKIIRFYSIENYLFHPDNLLEYYQNENNFFDPIEYKKNLNIEKNKVIEELIRKLAVTRLSYPFFKEPEFQNSKLQKRFTSSSENFEQVAEIENYLKSDIFENFYKVFPVKDYATQLNERQNLSKIELAKTNWFKKQIQDIIKS